VADQIMIIALLSDYPPTAGNIRYAQIKPIVYLFQATDLSAALRIRNCLQGKFSASPE